LAEDNSIMFRTFIAAALAAAAVLAPSAQAAQRPTYERTYLAKYGQLVHRHGVKAAGCNLVSGHWDNRCKQKGTRARVLASTATLRRMLYVPPPAPAPVAHTTTTTATAAAVPTSGGGGCGDLPSYIVQRESGGNPNAVSPSGQYIGCAQVDRSHFNAGGACAGMGYIECVNHLWNGGAGSSNWPTAANPPG
jgi:hypothetical protein